MASSAWCATTCSAAAPRSSTTMRWNGCSARPTTCAPSSRKQILADLGHRAHAAKLHCAHQLGLQDLERAPRARLRAGHRPEKRRAPGKHALRAEGAGFQDVDAAAHSAVEQDGELVPD